MKNILFAASEVVPFIKTGGLADVAGALPKYIDKKYFDVRTVLPLYSCIAQEWKDKMDFIGSFYMPFNERDNYVGVLHLDYEGVPHYFIDNQDYFTSNQPYDGIPYDIGRFAFFSKAVLSILPLIGFQPNIIHCHDWQTGLIPVYLRNEFQGDPFYWGIRSIMTIHNLKFQGMWDIGTVSRVSGLPMYLFTPDKLEFRNNGNMLKGGLVYADAITTVSSTYAEEIKGEYYGEGLDGLLRARSADLRGIVNGIDYVQFDPAKDPSIPVHFDSTNFRELKPGAKAALQEELGLDRNPDAMLISMVTRLTEQKGLDLVAYVMDTLCTDCVQICVLGTGEYRYEEMLRFFQSKYPGKVAARFYYNEGLSHRIYAGSDAFLMPSQFEPCGLSQLIALRYGTVPIVRETGGLKDTVVPYNEFTGEGTGFSFTNFNADEMLYIIRMAEGVYFDKKRNWNKIVEQGMNTDFSWNHSTLAYQELYDWLAG